jgi:hypothetical protein
MQFCAIVYGIIRVVWIINPCHRGEYEQIDKETLTRLKEVQNLDEETKKHIFATIDAFIAKTKIQSILK